MYIESNKTNKVACSEFVLQTATDDCCTMPVPNLLLPVYPLSLLRLYSQTGICESYVCVSWKSNPLVPSDAPVSPKHRNRWNHHSWLRGCCLCSVICRGLTLKPCLASTVTTIKFNQGTCVAFALYTAVDLSIAYAPVAACFR